MKRLLVVWKNMCKRCQDLENKLYGGRGISVCEEWKNSFEAFEKWALQNGYDENARRSKCTLDRIDNNGNYCPENCRWVDMKIQNNNKRSNLLITLHDETKTLSQWCDFYDIDFDVVWDRLQLGFTHEQALTQPIRSKYKYLEFQGEKKCLNQWAKEKGLSKDILQYRLKAGWSIEDCLIVPKNFDRKVVTIDGTNKTIKEHAKQLGISALELYKNLKRKV